MVFIKTDSKTEPVRRAWDYGVIYTQGDPRLQEFQRRALEKMAIEMHYQGMNEKHFVEGDMTGVVYLHSKESQIESVCGPEFRAEVDHERGKSIVRFIVRHLGRIEIERD